MAPIQNLKPRNLKAKVTNFMWDNLPLFPSHEDISNDMMRRSLLYYIEDIIDVICQIWAKKSLIKFHSEVVFSLENYVRTIFEFASNMALDKPGEDNISEEDYGDSEYVVTEFMPKFD